MEILRRIQSMKEVARRACGRGLKIGLVPTMGYLHDAHLSLIRHVKQLVDVLVVSVFVNPTQFGPDDDFDRYPRDLTRDADLCIAAGVDYLFAPDAAEMYPPGGSTIVEVEDLSARLEGESRPHHFRGVTTAVLKLLQIVQPDFAAFGQKDAQQAVIIQRMVKDLMLDVEITILPVVRDEDGVALSSRNAMLSEKARLAARAIPRALEAARHVVAEGQRKPQDVVAAAREGLEAEPELEVDYVHLVDREQLDQIEAVDGEVLLLVAVRAGDVRLIDNIVLKADGES